MKTSAFAQATPAVVILCWFTAFITMGIQSLIRDYSIRSDPCGKSAHMWKYAMVNTGYALFFLVTYLVMPRGGEGARARATLCLIIFGALGVWGTMLCMYMSPECNEIISQKFETIKQYALISTVHNHVFCVLFFLHEAYATSWIGSDMTVVFEVENQTECLTPDELAQFAPVHHLDPIADETVIPVKPGGLKPEPEPAPGKPVIENSTVHVPPPPPVAPPDQSPRQYPHMPSVSTIGDTEMNEESSSLDDIHRAL